MERLLAYLLKALLFPFVIFPKYWQPIPLSRWYGRLGINKPPLVGHTTAPTVTTDNTPSSITTSQAVFDTNSISSTGGENASARGICWVAGSGGTPTLSNSHTTENGSFSTGNFSATASSLASSTTYSVRAYATNSAGTGYGATVEVTTNGAPIVTTSSISSITSTSATVNANITSTGGATVTERGVCYIAGTSGTPTTADSKVSESGSFSTGTFSENLSSLTGEGSYRVRAYAINSSGTGYGTTLQLTLTDNPPTVTLNSPADAGTVNSTTPTLTFTGSDDGGDDIRYNIQIADIDTFDTSGTSLVSYSVANASADDAFTADITAIGQSFQGDGTHLTSAQFYLKTTGSPTGNAVARLYAHSGTFGSNGVPTGSVLATSTSLDVTTVTTSRSQYTFTFPTRPTVELGTNYVVVVEYSGGDASNFLGIAADHTSPTATGNYSRFNTNAWEGFSTDDLVYDIFTSPHVSFDKVSGIDSGFANTVTGGDTDPFTSGEKASYTVQAGDALTNGNTYYWRVRGIDPSGSNTYGDWATTRSFTVTVGGSSTLTAGQGSFTLTGQTAGPKTSRLLTAAHSSFSLTGIASLFRKGYSLVASQASFALTGQASLFPLTRRIAALQATFTLSGIATSLKAQRLLTAAAAAYTLTANTVSFINGFLLSAAQATFLLAGQTTGLFAGRFLTADHTSYTLSGEAILFIRSLIVTAVQASFSLAGQASQMLVGRLLSTVQAAFALTGVDIALTYDANSATLTADTASFSLSFPSAALAASSHHRIVITSRSFITSRTLASARVQASTRQVI